MSMATAAAADPVASTCRFLDVVSGNKVDEVDALMADLGSRWVDSSRAGAIESLTTLLTQSKFAGGNVYRIAQLGEDLEEHLVVLRLERGEVAGARLLYEWTPDGLALTTMEFKRKFSEMIASQFAQQPEPVACP